MIVLAMPPESFIIDANKVLARFGDWPHFHEWESSLSTWIARVWYVDRTGTPDLSTLPFFAGVRGQHLMTDRMTLSDIQAMALKALAVSDDAILEAVSRLLVSWNLEAAAEDYLAATGCICHFRPHLAEQLLETPVECLFQLGAETPEQVVAIVDFWLNTEPYSLHREATAEARQWLTQTFPTLTRLIDRLLIVTRQRFVERFGKE